MGIRPAQPDEDAATAWLARNGRDTHPVHRYSLEEYGSSEAEVGSMFKFYHDRYVS
jgi:hypothetical protein